MENDLELGTLSESFDEYNRIIRKRREKIGNTIWCKEWEDELSEKEIAILTGWNELKKMINLK